MPNRKVVILDGSPSGDEKLASILAILVAELNRQGAEIEIFTLREIKLGHCIGCFGCWVETPGICIEADAGSEIATSIVRSQMTILFTPVTFGGYSSALKRFVDRFIQLILPYFETYSGEIHHTPRYVQYPRLVGIGVQHHPNPEEARIFRTLVGRNAINFHAPSQAADVVLSTDTPAEISQRIQGLLHRKDAVPFGEPVTSLIPRPENSITGAEPGQHRRALLIVGSPKVKRPSTSSVLGGYLLDRLKEQGWETTSLTLRTSVNHEKGQTELLTALDGAGLVLLVFPLYIDTAPFLVTKAMEVIASHRRTTPNPPPLSLAAVCNCGFPEAHQNAVALAICRQFAVYSRMAWAGGLALGAGEALSSGQPLVESAGWQRPPVTHVKQALDLTAAALAAGQPVPRAAVTLIAKTPIPLVPFAIWRQMFMTIGNRHWEQLATEKGVDPAKLLDRPYAG